ncbi:MAG TPA: FUSC family protein, partial [Acidiphilium sp.]
GIKGVVVAIINRWFTAGGDVLASTLAGALAWMVARILFGHPHPVFAAIVAIVCLAPGIPSHRRQALGMLVGVGIGIATGELALLFPTHIPLLRGSVSIFVAMMIASSFGLGPVAPIQAGVSTILVFVLGPETAGYVRMVDSAVGIVVALIFSQLLVTPDPTGVVEKAARRMLAGLSAGFSQYDLALTNTDWRVAHAAVEQVSVARDSVIALDSSMRWARHAVRWSLRGRLVASRVSSVVARYDRQAIRLYASTLLFGEALTDALRKGGPPPPGLCEHVHRIAELYSELAAGKSPQQELPLSPILMGPVAQSWRPCVSPLLAAENALCTFATAEAPTTKNRDQRNDEGGSFPDGT